MGGASKRAEMLKAQMTNYERLVCGFATAATDYFTSRRGAQVVG